MSFLYHLNIPTIIKRNSNVVTASILPFAPQISSHEFSYIVDYINLFLLFFIPLLLLFTATVVIILGKTLRVYVNVAYLTIPVLIVAIVLFFSPSVMLVTSLFFSGSIFVMLYSEFLTRWVSQRLSSQNLLFYLEEIGLLPFFFRLYSFVFRTSSSFQFLLLFWSTHLLTLLYTIFSRYFIFFSFVIILPFPYIIYLLLLAAIFICLVSLIFRFLINLSLILVSVVLIQRPSLWNSFLLTEPAFNPDQTPKPQNLWFSRYSYQQNFNYNNGPIPPRFNLWKLGGLGIGLCTLGVGCFVAFQTWSANSLAMEANRLKRFELAKANPKDVDYIFRDHPQERIDYEQSRKK